LQTWGFCFFGFLLLGLGASKNKKNLNAAFVCIVQLVVCHWCLTGFINNSAWTDWSSDCYAIVCLSAFHESLEIAICCWWRQLTENDRE
jgi:hypothetical protein